MSTTQRVVRKQLAGAEDLLQGVGIVTQTRGSGSYPIHKLDIPIPTYNIAEMQASSAEFMRLYGTDTAYTDYRRNPEGTIGIPSNLGGVWEPMRSSEYLVCGNFATGAYVFSSDCIVALDQQSYNWQGSVPKVVAAGATPQTSGGIGAGAWVYRTDETLRSDLTRSILSQTLNDLYGLKNFVTPAEYGAIGDGTYHPLSEKFSTLTAAQMVYPAATSLTQSIDWAAISQCLSDNAGKDIFVPAGKYVVTDALVVPDFTTLTLSGSCYDFSGSTMILAYGTGARTHTIADCTATTVANPDAGAPYLADSGTRGNNYSTLNLSVAFSAFITLGVGSSIKGGGIYPYFDGVNGYLGTTGGMGADWDVGVWARNSNGWRIAGTCIEGHWRKAGLLVSAHDIGDGKVPSNELGQAVNCHFGGGYGVSIRTPSTATGTTNYGFAGTSFINCRLRSLNHQSLHLATSSALTSPLSIPSGCLEIDGPVMRGIDFISCTFITRDDVLMFLGDCNEIQFVGCYEESRNLKVSGSWITAVGSRVIATSSTEAVTFANNTKYGVDFSGYYPRESTVNRYTVSSAGVNNAKTILDSDYTNPIYSSVIAVKLKDASQTFSVLNSSGSHVLDVDSSGNIIPSGSLIQDGTVIRTKATTLNIQRVVSSVITNILSVYSSGNIELAGGTLTIPSDIKPKTTNSAYCGISSLAWAGGYTQTAFTVLSDEDYKQDINFNLNDALLDAWSTVKFCEFRFKDRVTKKGGAARYHIGVIAQQVKIAFESAGIDPFKYGILNYDEWEAGVSDDGSKTAAGKKYSINYEEALVLESALMRRTSDRLASRLLALESQ